MAGMSVSSETRRWWLLALPAALLLGAAAAVLPQPNPRLAGEFGLWVQLGRDTLAVSWLTETEDAGVLELHTGGAEPRRVTTPPGLAHRVVAPVVGRGDVVLRYGAAGDSTALHQTTVSLAAPRRAAVTRPAADTLFIVGDTHGVFDPLAGALRNAGLIDANLRWTGGRKQLAFAGDLMDRGPDVVRLLWFVYGLEREAAAAGGQVHVVLGNHEIMVMLGDLRYVHEKEQRIAQLHQVSYDRMFDIRRSVLGRWLASKPAVIRIGDVLIAHGGVTPEQTRLTLRAFDDTLSRYMREDLFYHYADTTVKIAMDSATFQKREDFFWGSNSVFWHRGYIQTDTASAQLDEVLRRWQARVLVIGHTAVPEISARYADRVIAAHTPRYGGELLLLTRGPDGARRFRVTGTGPPQEF